MDPLSRNTVSMTPKRGGHHTRRRLENGSKTHSAVAETPGIGVPAVGSVKTTDGGALAKRQAEIATKLVSQICT
jgi:hypothetical protein